MTVGGDQSDLINQAMLPTPDPAWQLIEVGYDPTREAGIEARFAISNGFLGVRASRAVSRGPTWVTYQNNLSWASWPRTYVAGLFDTPNVLPPTPALVPAPDWLRLRIWLDNRLVLLRSGHLLSHERILDLRRGLLLTDWEQRQPTGHLVRVRTLRLVSLANRALGLQLMCLTIKGDVAPVCLEASFEPSGSALDMVRCTEDGAVWRTAESGKTLAIAAHARLAADQQSGTLGPRDELKWVWNWEHRDDGMADFVRLAAFAKDGRSAEHVQQRAAEALAQAEASGWPALLAGHESAWRERWHLGDIEIDGDAELQRAVRFAIYHLNSAANPEDDRVSIGARALTGDAYLGHVFWDTEIYLLPFYTFSWPEAARALLMYRYHTLPGARAKAARLGYRGALYAWESTDTGEETTPEKVVDPLGRVIPVLCGVQEHHISADVAYAVWQYWQATADDGFFLAAGAEILLDTARFWASRTSLEDDARYHIRGVIGPDEYHETIDDNAYTNVMASWSIARGLNVVEVLEERWPEPAKALRKRLALDDSELELWRDVADRLVTGADQATGLIEQFEGYFSLEDIDISTYAGRNVPMDVILGRERTQASQVVKQADVVALLALLPDAFDLTVKQRNFRYYEPRCGHGSSLSTALHAVVAARLGDTAIAERYLRTTADIDFGSPAVGSAGGVHIAALGGLWLAVIFGMAGFLPRGNELTFDPALPDGWRMLAFRVQWRGRLVHVRIDHRRRMLTATLEAGERVQIRVGETSLVLDAGATVDFAYALPQSRS